jgi:hypothetical protein
MSVPYRLLHRFMGVCLALPLLLLVVTGIPLQFTVQLGLGSAGVPYAWVHAIYGIAAPATANASGEIVQLGDLMFVGERAATVSGELVGAARLPGALAVVAGPELILVADDTEVPMERNALPAVPARLGIVDADKLVIDVPGGQLWSDDFGATWDDQSATAAGIAWLEVVPRPSDAALRSRFGSANLSWERWLQDLHSGRFFGPVGIWVMNLASFVFILLGFTGLVLWFATRRANGRR